MTEKDSLIFVKHIQESIKNIDVFLKGVSENSFLKNVEKQSAVIRQLEIIGEAVKNIPDDFRVKYKDIPWTDIGATRDKIIHHYFGIKLEIIWNIIKKDLPILKKQINEIIKKES